jgi:hypothetical protein
MYQWSDKQIRCYHRIVLGVKRHCSSRLRFLTLTSVEGQKVSISKAFNHLNREIKDLTGSKLVADGYLSRNQAVYYYGSNHLDDCFKFHYLRVRTSEGVDGVFHVLFYGQYIPQRWILDVWKRLLGVVYVSPHGVDVRECKSDTKDGIKLSRYCVNQYVAGQMKYVRYHCSASWVYRGFVKDWEFLRSQFREYGCCNAEYYYWRNRGWFLLDLYTLYGERSRTRAIRQWFLGKDVLYMWK